MNGHDAFEEEMLGRLTDGDIEQLLRGRFAQGSEFAEVAEFTQALRQTLPARPDGASELARRLAETARMASPQGEIQTAPTPVLPRARRFRLQAPRFAAIARVTAALALVPLVFAGLAVAGVSVPEPARDAFKAVGVDLPNQPAENGRGPERSRGTGSDESGAGGGGIPPAAPGPKAEEEKGLGVSAEKRGRGTEQANPARDGGRANGTQGQGRALGKRDLAPGQVAPPGQIKKGEGGKAIGKAKPTPAPQSPEPSVSSGNGGQGNGGPSGKGSSNGQGGKAAKPAESPKG